MNILFNFINHASAIDGTDYRAMVFKPILYLLQKQGHHIWIDPHKKRNHPSLQPFTQLLQDFPTFSEKKVNSVDLWIVPYPHAKRKARYKELQQRKIPILVYEHGWLHQSVFVDRGNLFSDAYFAKSIRDIINKDFDPIRCKQYREQLLANNLSKRPQTSNWTVPANIDFKYIFIPIQKIEDVSIMSYSKVSMLDFITQVVQFAHKKNIDVVAKQHPHAVEDHKIIKKHIAQLQKKHNNIHLVDASIYHLMQHARFTACINSGSMADNFITQTPVFSAGKSFFYKSGSIVFDENVRQGLDTMLAQNYNWDDMKQQQAKMLWWLQNNLLFNGLTTQKNAKRLWNNACIKT